MTQPQPDSGQPTPEPEPPAGGGLRARLGGIGLSLLGYVLALVVALTELRSSDSGYTVLAYAVTATAVTVVLLVLGVALVIPQRTRAFGTGVLIGAAIGVLCGGGICFGVLATI
ncbi:hypothetical protein [Luedemannella helvata]|uniref:DUF4190 domain-containing protein n=1 Tax=Luedemannella helvata TaxID=349315 RepID=A0ABP4WC77_9ACTN